MTDIRIFVLILSAVLVGSAVLSICIGTVKITPQQILRALFSGERDTPEARIILYSRLPRTVACILAGAGLAVSGAIIQAVLANRLASPGIIGVNAGAGLAVNIRHIVRFEDNRLYMDNGGEIDISRHRMKEVKEQMHAFWRTQ